MDLTPLASKKLIMACLGIVALCVTMIFVGLPVEVFSSLFTAVIGLYTLGQGIADQGKEAQKIISDRLYYDTLLDDETNSNTDQAAKGEER